MAKEHIAQGALMVGKQFLMKITKGDAGRTKGINFTKYLMTFMNLLSTSFCEGGIWECELDTFSIVVFMPYESKLIYF